MTKFKIKVIPKSSKDEILIGEAGSPGNRLVKIKVTAAPTKGKANEAVIKLLSRELGLKKSQIAIVSGETSRIKIIELNGVTDDELSRYIEFTKNRV
ncbi:MAG: DUF167 domain-containing protein [bacterium]|nr:DUF167 domain-containing protein [bacterium]